MCTITLLVALLPPIPSLIGIILNIPQPVSTIWSLLPWTSPSGYQNYRSPFFLQTVQSPGSGWAAPLLFSIPMAHCWKFRKRPVPSNFPYAGPSHFDKWNLCLIPKFPNANYLKNFLPISLCNTSYKIITKIIANRIKPHLPTFVGPHQINFLKGRRACDNVILVQELVSRLWYSNSNKSSLIFKIDLEKAFDRLKWSFVYCNLRHFNSLLKSLLLLWPVYPLVILSSWSMELE